MFAQGPSHLSYMPVVSQLTPIFEDRGSYVAGELVNHYCMKRFLEVERSSQEVEEMLQDESTEVLLGEPGKNSNNNNNLLFKVLNTPLGGSIVKWLKAQLEDQRVSDLIPEITDVLCASMPHSLTVETISLISLKGCL